MEYLETHPLLSECQAGFRKRSSTIASLLTILHLFPVVIRRFEIAVRFQKFSSEVHIMQVYFRRSHVHFKIVEANFKLGK